MKSLLLGASSAIAWQSSGVEGWQMGGLSSRNASLHACIWSIVDTNGSWQHPGARFMLGSLPWSCLLGLFPGDLQEGTKLGEGNSQLSDPAINYPNPTDNTCRFEDEKICGFMQDKMDNFDWTRQNALTHNPKRTVNTGPPTDISGYYMFIEASRPRVTGDKARLISPLYNITAKYYCVSFYYHMYGKHIGAARQEKLEALAGSQRFDISERKSASKTSTLDMRRADFSLLMELMDSYKSVGPGGIHPRILKELTDVIAQPLLMTFEQSWESRGFPADWELVNVVWIFKKEDPGNYTPVGYWKKIFHPEGGWALEQAPQGTGHRTKPDRVQEVFGQYPQAHDVTLGDDPVQNQELDSKILVIFVTLWKHEVGIVLGGSLNLLVRVRNKRAIDTQVWSLSGNRGNMWQQAHVPINPPGPFQLIFEGVRGTSYEGDIAIDDVTLKKGDCPRKPVGPNKGETVYASEAKLVSSMDPAIPQTHQRMGNARHDLSDA
ncbi:hypothetical protein WISP_146768 [Willisornis vidua]|uniref:MAM domain-containing protein n=1 Tax=Willisornis vidua TaxID=1566151 RepID=A0ABQ9CR93_9PASS|nr:hypothetical protein WISP_146768 [Willisornis vidua]